jgi:hypothetical protein
MPRRRIDAGRVRGRRAFAESLRPRPCARCGHPARGARYHAAGSGDPLDRGAATNPSAVAPPWLRALAPALSPGSARERRAWS